MAERWICPRGHSGELPAGSGPPATCPQCGASLAPPTRALTGADAPPTMLTTTHHPDSTDAQVTVAPGQPPRDVEGPAVPGYEILGELGRGGMGVVYKARQVRLNRVVALKMILSGAHAGPQELQRFRLEAESVAQLQHPHVVQIHDVGEADGRAYLSLEFVDGGSLDRHLKTQPHTAEQGARLVATLARAMHAAHEQGIIHRDLKPANVLLTHDGAPKITDFGLAKRYTDSSGPTASQAIMGTPSYMAPEQAGGKTAELGPAVDTYALGAILYECLTGRPPFTAETPLDTVLLLVSEEPVPPRRLAPRCPRPLETICLKCLEKQPKKRYATALELAEDLERYLSGEPILARPLGPLGRVARWCRRQPAFAATVIGLGLFYLSHLLFMGVGVTGEGGAFHWFVTGLLGAWVAGAWGFQRLVRRPGWEEGAIFAWSSMDVCFFTLLLWQANGPQSSLVAGYLLLSAAAALRFRLLLVWFVTGLGIAGYLALAVGAHLWRPDVQVEAHRSIIFILFLAMMGLILHLLLRRTHQPAGT